MSTMNDENMKQEESINFEREISDDNQLNLSPQAHGSHLLSNFFRGSMTTQHPVESQRPNMLMQSEGQVSEQRDHELKDVKGDAVQSKLENLVPLLPLANTAQEHPIDGPMQPRRLAVTAHNQSRRKTLKKDNFLGDQMS